MMRRTLPLASVVLTALLGCERSVDPQSPAAPTPTPAAVTATAPQPLARSVPVVIYLIDTLRSDRVGAYGHKGGLTPNMDVLAAEGVLFEQAYAPAPWTLPSVTSLMTSTFVTEHGAIYRDQQLPGSLVTLAQRLAEHGYANAAFTSNAFGDRVAGAGGGYATRELRKHSFDPASIERWLDANAAGPFHLYVHTTEPHTPYAAPQDLLQRRGRLTHEQCRAASRKLAAYRHLKRPEDAGDARGEQAAAPEAPECVIERLQKSRKSLEQIYDAHVVWADANLGDFIEMLKRRGDWDRCMFILVADHGEEFDEHRGWLHGQSVYEELARVPLIVRFPKREHAGRRVQAPVSLVDVPPTIFDYLGAGEPWPSCRGRSLLPHVRGEAGGDDPRIVTVRINQEKDPPPNTEAWGGFNVAARHGKWKGIWNAERNQLELYDLAADPLEQRNVAEAKPRIAERLRTFIQTWLREERRPNLARQGISERERENLKELGYLGDE